MNQKKGITIIYTILILSIALTISAHIFTTVLKETRLSALGRDSQFAIYVAESGLECALYWDIRQNAFNLSSPASSVDCAGNTASVTENPDNVFSFSLTLPPENYKVDVVVDKTNSTNPVVTSRGYNTGDTSDPRRVERGLQMSYADTSGGQSGSCAVDLVLSLDHSGSIDPDEYLLLRDATVEIAQNLPISNDKIRIAADTFTGFTFLKFALTGDKSFAVNELQNLPQDPDSGLTTPRREKRGTNMSGGALISQNELNFGTNSRSGADKAILIITDGATNLCTNPDGSGYLCGSGSGSAIPSSSLNPTKEMWERANSIKRNDTFILAIGVGLQDSISPEDNPCCGGMLYADYMRDFVVSKDPDGNPLFFPVTDFEELLTFVEIIDCNFFGRRLSDFERKEI